MNPPTSISAQAALHYTTEQIHELNKQVSMRHLDRTIPTINSEPDLKSLVDNIKICNVQIDKTLSERKQLMAIKDGLLIQSNNITTIQKYFQDNLEQVEKQLSNTENDPVTYNENDDDDDDDDDVDDDNTDTDDDDPSVPPGLDEHNRDIGPKPLSFYAYGPPLPDKKTDNADFEKLKAARHVEQYRLLRVHRRNIKKSRQRLDSCYFRYVMRSIRDNDKEETATDAANTDDVVDIIGSYLLRVRRRI